MHEDEASQKIIRVAGGNLVSRNSFDEGANEVTNDGNTIFILKRRFRNPAELMILARRPAIMFFELERLKQFAPNRQYVGRVLTLFSVV